MNTERMQYQNEVLMHDMFHIEKIDILRRMDFLINIIAFWSKFDCKFIPHIR